MKAAAADALENSISSVATQSFINPDSTTVFFLSEIEARHELDSKGLKLAPAFKTNFSSVVK